MPGANKAAETPVITLLPPHYHNDAHFKYLIEQLRILGIEAIAPHLEIGDPRLTRDDHAEVMLAAEKEKGAESYMRAGLSWGGDIIYRELDDHVSKLVFEGAPLRQVIYRLGVQKRIKELANNPKLAYAAYVAGEKEFNREELAKIFYQRLGIPAVKSFAMENLDEHPHVHEDPEKDTHAVLPSDIEKYYVGFVNDEIFDFSNQQRTAQFFNMDFIPMTTGHFAMLEDPKTMAELLAQIARGKIDKAHWWQLFKQDRQNKLANSPSIKPRET